MKRIVEKHSLAIRWFHWINFPVLLAMIWSGMLIYWAYDPYKIQIGGTVLVSFFPDWLYKAWGIPFRLGEGMAWHFVFMWIFTVNGILYVAYTLVSGEWRLLLPNRQSFKEAWLVLLHDLGLRRQAPAQQKYNGAQRIAYTAVSVMGIGSLLTGLAIYKPIQVAWLTNALGGYQTARLQHFVLTIGYVLFFLIHVVQVIRAGWNNFRGMVAGFEVVEPPA